MAVVEILMPKMGESVMEGTILAWLKDIGEYIAEEETLLEVATDKVDAEIPSTHEGVLKEILAEKGEVVQIGKPIALIEVASDESSVSATIEIQESAKAAEELIASALVTASSSENSISLPQASPSSKFYSPLVRSIAKKEKIDFVELETIPGTGKEGRLTKNDLLSYLKSKKAEKPSISVARPEVTDHPSASSFVEGYEEIIEMDHMRKMIAERMLVSKQISAHVSSFVEVDMTRVVNWRNGIKEEFKKREGQSITYTPIVIEAVVQAIHDFPLINIQVNGDKIIKKGSINIGMATALPTGNLIVPVIRNAGRLSLVELIQKVNDLAKRARENKLTADELHGGTYTVSNIGTFGNLMGTPIIMQPQVAIMAVGAIQKKPAVIETDEGDMIAIRYKMFLSHSYDHRVIDGALGGMFVRKVADYLEAFDPQRII